MHFKDINEEQAIKFTKTFLDYYKKIDAGSVNSILTYKDTESRRNNVGWYQHVDGQHKIFINIPNIMIAQYAVERKIINSDGFYAFLTLCIGHEFRHFLQGRVIYDGQEIDGYTQKDVFNSELMLYIRYFFDAYYLLNKGNVKYELDAEKFSITNGIKYLKNKYPNMDAEKSMLDAINFFANIQSEGNNTSTLPNNGKSIADVIQKIQKRIDENSRIAQLDKTLYVHNLKFYQTHIAFGLDEDKDEVITKQLLKAYYKEKDGYKRDLLVVKRILSLLKYPMESLEEFPTLKKSYIENKL